MEPEQVLDLIRSTPERYDTVRAALRYRGDGSTIKALRARYLASEAGRREIGDTADQLEEDGFSEPDGPFGWRCRLWYAKVGPERGVRYRLELDLPEEVYPGGGVDFSAWDGRIGGPRGQDTFVSNRIGGGSREEDPHWMSMAQDSFWTTYLLDPDNIAGLPLCALDFERGGQDAQGGPGGHSSGWCACGGVGPLPRASVVGSG